MDAGAPGCDWTRAPPAVIGRRKSSYHPQGGLIGISGAVMPAGHAIAPAILEGAYDYFNEKDMLMPIKSAKPGAQILDIHLVKNIGIEP